MPLTIVRTGLTNDQSAEYLKEIKDLHCSGTDRQLILVVPDQFSYIAEKRICDTVGGAGINGVSVITPHQLMRRVSSHTRLLADSGKQLIIKKIIKESFSEENIFFGSGNKTGFIGEILGIVSGWKKYGVDVDEIKAQASGLENEISKEKLISIADIYEKYVTELEESGCADDSDCLFLAAEDIRNDKDLKGAVVWMDEFSEFTPAELEIIRAFLESDGDVRFYLPIPDDEDEDGFYNCAIASYYNIIKMCMDYGFKYNVRNAKKEKDMSPELKFLCEKYDSGIYDRPADGIVMHCAEDIYSETEYAASEIVGLVTEKEYSYSDISVMCGNINAYSSCIEAMFERYNIPYFSDYKTPLSGHPVSILLMSVFEMVNNMAFPIKSVVRYLKTGYPAASPDEADMLADFAERRGIVGNMWTNPKYFVSESRGFFDTALGKEEIPVRNNERLEEVRRTVILPLCTYAERSKGKKSLNEHISVFFEFLNDIKLFEKIEVRVLSCENAGDENEAARLTHVWNILTDIFNQMSAAAGEEKVTGEEFGEYLKTAIDSAEISIIPTVTDGVCVSDSGRRTGTNVRALFILGATYDSVPKTKKEDGIITDDELEAVSSIPNNNSKNSYNRRMELELLRAISDTSQLLYLSNSLFDAEGTKTENSRLFEVFRREFPFNKLTLPDELKKRYFISAPNVMLHRLLAKIANGDELSSAERYAIDWFGNHSEYSDAFSLISEAEAYKQMRGSISKEISLSLYENLTQYSVSRLEQYFSCPFKYFMNYGLGIKEEARSGVQSTDTGSLVHFVIKKLCDEIESENPGNKKAAWDKASIDKCDEIINRILSEVKEKTEPDNRLENTFDRMYSVLHNAAEILLKSLQKSKYGILSCELDFSGFKLETGKGDITFGGIIDRIDEFEEDGKKYIRIIDYKTGNKEYNAADILNGKDLQLMIYAMAAMEKYGADVTGMFYNVLKIRHGTGKTEADAINDFQKSRKLSGYVFASRSNDGILDLKTGVDMDEDLAVLGESSYLRLKATKSNTYHMGSSKVGSEGEFLKMKGYVRDIVVGAAENIKNGDTRVYPLYGDSQNGACTYCPYSTACMFDIENGAEINDGSTGKNALRQIREEEKKQ